MMISISVIAISLCLGAVTHAQGPRVPDPLPENTPDDVVNLLLQNLGDTAGDLVASVIGADATAATYQVNCNPEATLCGFDTWHSPIVITQGLSSMMWTYSEIVTSENYQNSMTHLCTFAGTTAKTAVCTNYYTESAITSSKFPQDEPNTGTPTTRTYDGRLSTATYVMDGMTTTWEKIDFIKELYGPPPFIPVRITAGIESLSAFRAVSTAPSTSTGAHDAKATGSGSDILPGQSVTTQSSATIGIPAGNSAPTSTSAAGELGYNLRCLVVATLGFWFYV